MIFFQNVLSMHIIYLFQITSKGLQKKRFTNAWNTYMKVLAHPRERAGVTNIGFRNFKTKIYTYRQKRLGLRHVYFKRVLDQSGIDTHPLNIVCPKPAIDF